MSHRGVAGLHQQQQHQPSKPVAAAVAGPAFDSELPNRALSAVAPVVQAHWFRQHQQSTIEQVRGQLWSHWLPKCIEVFRRLPPVPINNDAKAYFRCGYGCFNQRAVALVALCCMRARKSGHRPRCPMTQACNCCRRSVTTLQSNMLRQLVSSSLQDYLEFFKQHTVVQPLDPQQDTAMWSCMPVFEVDLVPQDGEWGCGACAGPTVHEATCTAQQMIIRWMSPAGCVVFEPTLESTQTVVLAVLEAAVLAAADLPRITPASTSSGVTPAPAASGAAGPGSSPSVIPSTGLDEGLVQDTLKV